jgi:hypothetical protein
MAMIQDPQQFWDEVKLEAHKIAAAITKQELQPRFSGVYNFKAKQQPPVYITSVRQRGDQPEVRAGVVSECGIALAGQRCYEGVATLSSDAEIAEYHKAAATKKREMEAAAASTKGQVVFAQPKPVA